MLLQSVSGADKVATLSRVLALKVKVGHFNNLLDLSVASGRVVKDTPTGWTRGETVGLETGLTQDVTIAALVDGAVAFDVQTHRTLGHGPEQRLIHRSDTDLSNGDAFQSFLTG